MSGNARPLENLAVLIAEDSWHLADALRMTVEGAGGKVVGMAGTLAESEELADTLTFNAAVLDLDLHGEMSRDLALRLADRGIKVVLLTGHTPSAALAKRVHACISKPAEPDEVIAALALPLASPRA